MANHGEFAADDGFQGRFVVGNHLANGGTDQADALAQFAPVGGGVSLGEQFDASGGGSEIAGQGAEERCFAGAVGAEDDPMLPLDDFPGYFVENQRLAPLHGQVGNGEDRGGWVGHRLLMNQNSHHISPEMSRPASTPTNRLRQYRLRAPRPMPGIR